LTKPRLGGNWAKSTRKKAKEREIRSEKDIRNGCKGERRDNGGERETLKPGRTCAGGSAGWGKTGM